MKRLTRLGGLVALLPVVCAAACGSINAVTDDGGGGAAGAGGGPAGAGGGAAGAGGSSAKDGGAADSTPADAIACMLGERRCDDDTPMTCDASGVWRAGAACSNRCAGGTCVGVCTSSAKMCVGNIPQLCDAQGMWQAAPACTYVCRQGDCTGVCLPGARQCSPDGAPQTCNADGAWETSAACPFVCGNGVCSGVCQPGQTACNGNTPQTCTSAGDWQPGAACPFVCSNGQCAGSCTPGAHQCASNVPQTCSSNGAWQDGAPCPYVCSGGACGGSCVPGATQCANGQKQICDAGGNWQGTVSPPVQLLANAGFDGAHTSWTETTALSSSTIITSDSALTSIKAQTPSYVAWLGGYPNAQDDLSQTVTVPAGATSITLSFYYAIFTAEITLGARDTMDVYTYDTGSASYTTVASFNDDMPTSSWARFTISLPPSLAGRTFEVGFRATTDTNKNTNFFVDSVSLDVVACTP